MGPLHRGKAFIWPNNAHELMNMSMGFAEAVDDTLLFCSLPRWCFGAIYNTHVYIYITFLLILERGERNLGRKTGRMYGKEDAGDTQVRLDGACFFEYIRPEH